MRNVLLWLHHWFQLLWALVLALLLGGHQVVSAQVSRYDAHPRLALLIGALWPGETAMHNDLVIMYDALRQRNFSPEDLLLVEGVLNRRTLLAVLHAVHERIEAWHTGEVVVYISGHGTYRGTTAAIAEPGVLLQETLQPTQEDVVWWEEIFHALAVPQGVHLTVVPDT